MRTEMGMSAAAAAVWEVLGVWAGMGAILSCGSAHRCPVGVGVVKGGGGLDREDAWEGMGGGWVVLLVGGRKGRRGWDGMKCLNGWRR